MKKLILFCALSLSAMFAMAQSDSKDHKFSIGVSVGPGIPYGDFANSQKTNDTTRLQGAAKTGFHFNVNASLMFNSNIGAVIQVGGSTHAVDEARLTSSTNAPGTFTASGSYYVGQYLIGPLFAAPMGNDFTFEGKILIGMMTLSCPEITETTGLGSVVYTFEFKPSFAYGAGVAFRYHVNDIIGLRLGADYIGSTLVSDHVAASSGSLTYAHDTERKATIGLLNPTFGIVFGF